MPLTNDQRHNLIAWHNQCLEIGKQIAHVMISPDRATQVFYRDTAEQLESLAARVRREAKS